MTLDEALRVLSATGPDVDAALLVVGAHLAALAGEAPDGMTALAVGVAAVSLADGAADHLFGGRRPYVVAARQTESWAKPVDLRWMTAQPPAGRPLGLFVHRIVTGVTVRAVLDDLDRPPDGPPITLFTVTAHTAGLQAVRDAHPIAQVFDPEGKHP